MSSETTDPRAAWHAGLAERDSAAHARMSESAHRSQTATLQHRLDAVTAELDICRAAVQRRSQLLDEQAHALRERDAYIAELESRISSTPAPRPPHRSLARRVASRARRFVRARLGHA